jgi:hypothetical protein
MKRVIFFLLFLVVLSTAAAQEKKVYTTTSGEIILSWADITYNGDESESVVRFSPVLNIQNYLNIDKTEHFGMFTGLSLRNVGFIYDVPDSTIRKKYRTYSLGVPIGLKLGNLNGKFFFVGYELEFPFNYKEKTFEDEEKIDKKVIWFTDRVNTFNHSIMAGIQMPYGATLKFKYYFTNFFNKDFKLSDGTKPYANSDYNVFYFSLSFGLLKNTDFYYSKD